MKLSKLILIISILIAVAFVAAGCGGGGGDGGGNQTSGVVITGTIKSYQNQSKVVPNATVLIATYSAKTDSAGRFRIVMSENVVNPTFRVTVPSGYYSQLAYYQGSFVDPAAIPTPLPLYNNKDLGTIYLWDLEDGGPPPPPY